jgi:hypothetical protein
MMHFPFLLSKAQLHSVIIQRLPAVLLALVFAAAVSLAGGGRPAAGWQIETGEFHSDLSGKKLPLAVSIRAGLPFLSYFFEARRPDKPAGPPPHPSAHGVAERAEGDFIHVGRVSAKGFTPQGSFRSLLTPLQPRAPPAA